MTRRYRVVFADGSQSEHVAFHLAQREYLARSDALHFDRHVLGGWIPLGWRTDERPQAERAA